MSDNAPKPRKSAKSAGGNRRQPAPKRPPRKTYPANAAIANKVPSPADAPVPPAPASSPAADAPATPAISDATIKSDVSAINDLERHLYAHRYAETGMSSYGLTIDPPNVSADRAEAMAILEQEDHDLLCTSRIGSTLERLSRCSDRLDPTTLAQVRILKRDRDRLVNVSSEDKAAFTRLTNETDSVWRRAKLNNDWDSFEPYLDRIVAAMRGLANQKDPGADPYDVWLDEYEQGSSREFYNRFFAMVKDCVVPLLMDVRTKRQPSRACIEGRFDEGRQWMLARDIAILEGIDLDSYWLTATEHPFSDALSVNYPSPRRTCTRTTSLPTSSPCCTRAVTTCTSSTWTPPTTTPLCAVGPRRACMRARPASSRTTSGAAAPSRGRSSPPCSSTSTASWTA